jgi:predicted transcriptional regulator
MTKETTTSRSVIGELRELVPPRALAPAESRQIIERQATRLLKLMDVAGPPVPVGELLERLPWIEVKRFPALPTSGRAQWTGGKWVILVDGDEPKVRQRFSMAHELGHVIYHPIEATLPATKTVTAEARLEQTCEYFAACVLMPRVWLKRAYYNDNIQDLPSLARFFGVSWDAMRIRLEQLGMVAVVKEAKEVA